MPLFSSGLPLTNIITLFSSTVTQTVAATTTETTVIGTGYGSLALPANFLTVGKTLRFAIRGLYSTPVLNIGNLAIKLKLGSTTLNTSSIATGMLLGLTNAGFEGEAFITCRSTGVSGTVILMGGLQYSTGSNASPVTVGINNGSSTTTIDTSIVLAFDCTVAWSNNVAGNTISALNCTLEALN